MTVWLTWVVTGTGMFIFIDAIQLFHSSSFFNCLSLEKAKIFWLVEETGLAFLCFVFWSWTNHCSPWSQKGKEFPNWALDHFTRHAFYVLLPFHPLSAGKQCKLSLTLECTSARMLFKLSHLIKLMVLRSSVKSGPRLKMHHQFNSLFTVWYLRWVWWAYTTKNSYLFRCPLWVTKIIINFIKLSFKKISFQIGLVKSSTYC